jgi:hypothetical protein
VYACLPKNFRAQNGIFAACCQGFTKKGKVKTTLNDKPMCSGVSKQSAISNKQYITDGFVDHLFYLFPQFY